MRPATVTDLGLRNIIAAGRGWCRFGIFTTITTTTAMVGITTDIGFDTPNTG